MAHGSPVEGGKRAATRSSFPSRSMSTVAMGLNISPLVEISSARNEPRPSFQKTRSDADAQVEPRLEPAQGLTPDDKVDSTILVQVHGSQGVGSGNAGYVLSQGKGPVAKIQEHGGRGLFAIHQGEVRGGIAVKIRSRPT